MDGPRIVLFVVKIFIIFFVFVDHCKLNVRVVVRVFVCVHDQNIVALLWVDKHFVIPNLILL